MQPDQTQNSLGQNLYTVRPRMHFGRTYTLSDLECIRAEPTLGLQSSPAFEAVYYIPSSSGDRGSVINAVQTHLTFTHSSNIFSITVYTHTHMCKTEINSMKYFFPTPSLLLKSMVNVRLHPCASHNHWRRGGHDPHLITVLYPRMSSRV